MPRNSKKQKFEYSKDSDTIDQFIEFIKSMDGKFAPEQFFNSIVASNGASIPSSHSNPSSCGFLSTTELKSRRESFQRLSSQRIKAHTIAMSCLQEIINIMCSKDKRKNILGNAVKNYSHNGISNKLDSIKTKRESRLVSLKEEHDQTLMVYDTLIDMSKNMTERIQEKSDDSIVHHVCDNPIWNSLLGNENLMTVVFSFLPWDGILSFRACCLSSLIIVSKLPIHLELNLDYQLTENMKQWLTNSFCGKLFGLSVRISTLADVAFLQKFIKSKPLPSLSVHIVANKKKKLKIDNKVASLIAECRPQHLLLCGMDIVPKLPPNSLKSLNIMYTSKSEDQDPKKYTELLSSQDLISFKMNAFRSKISSSFLSSLCRMQNLSELGLPHMIYCESEDKIAIEELVRDIASRLCVFSTMISITLIHGVPVSLNTLILKTFIDLDQPLKRLHLHSIDDHSMKLLCQLKKNLSCLSTSDYCSDLTIPTRLSVQRLIIDTKALDWIENLERQFDLNELKTLEVDMPGDYSELKTTQKFAHSESEIFRYAPNIDSLQMRIYVTSEREVDRIIMSLLFEKGCCYDVLKNLKRKVEASFIVLCSASSKLKLSESYGNIFQRPGCSVVWSPDKLSIHIQMNESTFLKRKRDCDEVD